MGKGTWIGHFIHHTEQSRAGKLHTGICQVTVGGLAVLP